MTQVTDPRAQLNKAGIALQPANDREPSAPWYLLILQGIGGWLSALFLMGFLGLGIMQVLELTAVTLVLGLLLIAGAYGLLRRSQNVFIEQLVLAFSLAGQLLVAYAIGRGLNDINAPFWFFLFALHSLLAVLMASRMHRVFSALFAALSLFFFGAETGLVYIMPPLALALVCALWLNEFRHPAHRNTLKFIAMGLTLGLLVMQYLIRFPTLVEDSLSTIWLPHWLGEWLTGATLAYLAYRVAQVNHTVLTARTMMAGLSALALLCLASSFAYGLTQGAVLLALGFAISHRLITGLGILSLMFSMSTYYYRLDLTLLEKSATLLTLGVFLLAIRYALSRWPQESNGGAANA